MQHLYEQFIPESYRITWDLRNIARKRQVSGMVDIYGTQVHDGTIRLHAKQLNIKRVLVNQQEISEMYIEKDELVIPHKGAGQVTVTIEFSLTVKDTMHGIYPCYYTVDGHKQELYATQFESHHAREAFPCIDEPEAKATFNITLITEDTTVLGNMPIKEQHHNGSLIVTTFDTTPRMSSYLVAFVVGDLQRATASTKSGVEVNVYATRAHRPEALAWALEHAVASIEFYDQYFDIPYPLPKSDHVALPDFSSGAMENWGLITYREVALLADPATATISSKRYITTVIAHELSHQWFGNLVTMKWWDNLWLNESFATIMEYLPPDALHPDWNIWFDFASNEGVAALRRDSIDSVQPVQVAVNHPDEIGTLFDGAIVYAKGGRLLRMMQLWIGDNAFRHGLKAYFTKHAYDNTTGDDLWLALSESSGKDVGTLMNAWITQPGYPVVHATLEDDKLTLSQEQFFIGPHGASSRLWPIPLDSTVDTLPDIMDQQTLTIPYISDAPVYLNQHNNGHFITLYDAELRARIVNDIIAGRLSETQRAQYLTEQTLLARGGYISSATLVELLTAFQNESNEKVWQVIAMAISDLKRFVETDKTAEANLRRLVANLARPQFERLGWDPINGESEDDTELRSLVIGLMIYGEDANVVAEASRRYHELGIDRLDSELRGTILTSVVRNDDNPRDIDALLDLYRKSSDAELKSIIASAVTSTKNHRQIARLIKSLTDTKLIRQQDTIHWYLALLRNRDGRTATWQWLRRHWKWVEAHFASDKSHDYFPRYSASVLSTRQQLDEFRDFFTPLRDNPALTRAIDMGLLDLEGRIALLERDTEAVASALNRI
ncbi:aminopeptidase [Candidatus Saccharibacteria bacterium oral taxon 955]|nr:aminopeptidase [Candidatus Saccharibacteria bacterium oral taxon 955]